MSNLSQTMVEGFVTHDPVIRQTKTGKKICAFSVAVNHYSKTDTTTPQVSYFDIETWERVASFCSDNINKGKHVMVFGNIRQDRWEGKDGKIQSKVKIVGREVRFFERRITTNNENTITNENRDLLEKSA